MPALAGTTSEEPTMSAILKRESFGQPQLGGGGGGRVPPYLAALGVGSIEIISPSRADRQKLDASAIGFCYFRDDQPAVPITKGCAKAFVAIAASDPGVVRIDAPTLSAIYTQYGVERHFSPDQRVHAMPGTRLLTELGIEQTDFFVYFQPCKFADQDISGGCAALRVGTGLPVITLNEVQINRLRREYLNG